MSVSGTILPVAPDHGKFGKFIMRKYALIDHTADIGIRVRGQDLIDLFTQAAEGTFDIIAGQPDELPDVEQKQFSIVLTADHAEQLLVDWLNELVSLSDAEQVIFVAFDIQKLSKRALQARVRGISRHHYEIEREIKAVTSHELQIRKSDKELEAEIIFDV